MPSGRPRCERRARWSAGYARATAMLRPQSYPTACRSSPKLAALEQAATGTGGTFYRPPINVTFEDGVNHVGVYQQACRLCGDCVSGCNYGAKNTTLMNYLPDAVNHGAEIYTQARVSHVERRDGRWLVHYRLLDAGRERFEAPELFVSAEVVVLGAGALGSTEILLRSEKAGPDPVGPARQALHRQRRRARVRLQRRPAGQRQSASATTTSARCRL